jgi:hypothetical protein
MGYFPRDGVYKQGYKEQISKAGNQLNGEGPNNTHQGVWILPGVLQVFL